MTRRSGAASVLALFLVLQVVLAWYPFEYDPPRYVDNTVELASGVASFTGTSVLLADRRESWFQAMTVAASVTVELRARATTTPQFGPARLLAVSRTLRSTDLVIGQQGDALEVRTRRRGGSADGTPPIRVPGLFASAEVRSITVRLSGAGVEVEVDGEVVAKEAVDASPRASWDPRARLALGDDVNYGREWQGVLERATVRVDGAQAVDLLAPGVLDRPDGHWIGTDRITDALSLRFDGHWGIALARVLLAVPIGWALAMILRRRLAAAVVAFVLLAVINAGKVYVAGRHPYLLDVVISTGGVVIGVLLAGTSATTLTR